MSTQTGEMNDGLREHPLGIGEIRELLEEMRTLHESEGDMRRADDEWRRRFGSNMRSDLMTLDCLVESLTKQINGFFCHCKGGGK